MSIGDVAVLLSLSMTETITQLVKITVGRPRPGKYRALRFTSHPETFNRFNLPMSACAGL